tara:strand:+ start:1387 stop:1767 length:381 start_codon:yes stop_codon:yes gene_type:complete
MINVHYEELQKREFTAIGTPRPGEYPSKMVRGSDDPKDIFILMDETSPGMYGPHAFKDTNLRGYGEMHINSGVFEDLDTLDELIEFLRHPNDQKHAERIKDINAIEEAEAMQRYILGPPEHSGQPS